MIYFVIKIQVFLFIFAFTLGKWQQYGFSTLLRTLLHITMTRLQHWEFSIVSYSKYEIIKRISNQHSDAKLSEHEVLSHIFIFSHYKMFLITLILMLIFPVCRKIISTLYLHTIKSSVTTNCLSNKSGLLTWIGLDTRFTLQCNAIVDRFSFALVQLNEYCKFCRKKMRKLPLSLSLAIRTVEWQYPASKLKI